MTTTLLEQRGLFFDSTAEDGIIHWRQKWGKGKGILSPIHLSYRVRALAPPASWEPDGDYGTLHQLRAGRFRELYGNLRRDIEKGKGDIKNVFQMLDHGVKDVDLLGNLAIGDTAKVELTVDWPGSTLVSDLVSTLGNVVGRSPVEGLDLRELDLLFGNPPDDDPHSARSFIQIWDVKLTHSGTHTPLWETVPTPIPPPGGDDLAALRRSLETMEAGLKEAFAWLEEKEAER